MTLEAGYFEERYARRDDPWRLADPWYEERKRALTAAMLPRARFASGLEIGCSIGTLTAELAPRCDRLHSTDIAPRAIELARERLAATPAAAGADVTFSVMAAPGEWPAGRFDLLVISEVGYYLDERDLALLALRGAASLTDDGAILACHWRHPVAEYPVSGDRVHEVLRAIPGLAVFAVYRDADVIIEVLAPASTVSVAAADGLV